MKQLEFDIFTLIRREDHQYDFIPRYLQIDGYLEVLITHIEFQTKKWIKEQEWGKFHSALKLIP